LLRRFFQTEEKLHRKASELTSRYVDRRVTFIIEEKEQLVGDVAEIDNVYTDEKYFLLVC